MYRYTYVQYQKLLTEMSKTNMSAKQGIHKLTQICRNKYGCQM